MKEIYIYTDGACKGNPGPGGWGAILKYKDHQKEISGYEPMTTNNRMEITALIEALAIVKEPCNINVYSDSQYLCKAIQNDWINKWKNNNWYKNKKEAVANVDLWEKILTLIEPHNIKIEWVKGHSGFPENERCDKLAVEAIKKGMKDQK